MFRVYFQHGVFMTQDAELAERYRWFCVEGWKRPVLNCPEVILGKASPQLVDSLIQAGMKRWPLKNSPNPPKRAA